MSAEPDYYDTIDQRSMAEFKDRSSQFIAYACPLSRADEFQNLLTDLKKEHAKATHHCFAYRLGLDGLAYRHSDDGEPRGTAGRPILAQIDHRGLTDLCVVVVRYFGGSLLGVPGLIHAYKSAASMVLQITPVVRKSVEITYSITFDYSRMHDVMAILKKTQGKVIARQTQLFCMVLVNIPKSRVQEALHLLQVVRGLEISVMPSTKSRGNDQIL
jgi:uncharacterized YigZ family protein